jgi:ATP-dependent Clp protease ATP-binding subunit ClpC
MGPFDRFNDRAKRVLALAQDEAIRMHHEHLGVEHLGLALIREGQGVAAHALRSLGVDPNKFRIGVETAVPRGDPDKDISRVTLTPRVKRIIELANEEATRRGDAQVGTEHLLLAIAKEGESVTASVLRSIGVAMDQVIDEVSRIIRDDKPRPPT